MAEGNRFVAGSKLLIIGRNKIPRKARFEVLMMDIVEWIAAGPLILNLLALAWDRLLCRVSNALVSLGLRPVPRATKFPFRERQSLLEVYAEAGKNVLEAFANADCTMGLPSFSTSQTKYWSVDFAYSALSEAIGTRMFLDSQDLSDEGIEFLRTRTEHLRGPAQGYVICWTKDLRTKVGGSNDPAFIRREAANMVALEFQAVLRSSEESSPLKDLTWKKACKGMKAVWSLVCGIVLEPGNIKKTGETFWDEIAELGPETKNPVIKLVRAIEANMSEAIEISKHPPLIEPRKRNYLPR
jgi:hypothetical protein